MHEKLVSLLNTQIREEFYSAYLYLDFANFYEAKGLHGFAHWFKVQAKEELDHGMLLYQYLQNNNGAVVFETIASPKEKCDTLAKPLYLSLEHEQFVTSSINHIYDIARDCNDYRLQIFLNWFIKEQAEEENSAQDLITRMELFGKDAKGLYILDGELKMRKYSPVDYDFD